MGPLPPEVYWRRRLALLGVLVVALFVSRAFLTADTSRAQPKANAGKANAGKSSQDGTLAHPYVPRIGSAAPTPLPASAATPAGAANTMPTCADADLRLTAATDASTYKVGAKPKVSMTVRNASGRACQRALGTAATELIITSGPVHTWSSDDCEPVGDTGPQVLKAGVTWTYSLPWSGKRAAPRCAIKRTPAGPGTYQLQGRLGTLLSVPVVFHVA